MIKKNLGLFVLLAVSLLSKAQTNPTIDNVYFEEGTNFCANTGYHTLKIDVTDLDGDVVNISSISFTNSSLEYLNSFAPVTVGFTTTFTYLVGLNTVTPPGTGVIVNETMTIVAVSISGLDPSPTATDVMSTLVVNGPVFAEFSNPNPIYCENGLPVDISADAIPAGGTYSWGYTWPSTLSNSTAFDPSKAYEFYLLDGGDGYDINYSVENVNGCIGTANASVSFYDAPEAGVSQSPSTCGGATGQAMASIFNGSAPYNVYWSTGFAESGVTFSQITNLSSGVYYLNITDANGCKNVVKANISDADISVTAAIDPSRCAGQNGSVALDITPTTGTVDNIYWSNGSTSQTLMAGPGEYSVAIHTTANCNYFGTYTILDSALKVKLDGYSPNYNCISAPTGEFLITTSGGFGAYTWDWKKNGSTVWTGEDIIGIDGGLYTCTVQDGNGCSLTWGKTMENPSNVYLWTEEVVQPTCGNTDGSINVFIDNTGDVPAFYEWSTGATSEDLTGLAAGNYTLTYTDQAGCTNYLTVKLTNERPYQPTICLLTVDTSLIYNMIVWEKDITQNIEGFNIYRETSVFGEFEKVASRDYSLESFYQDNDASPVDRSWRYYITTFDACGGESYGSFVHKTIHVVSSTVNGTDYSIHWDNYEGISYTSIDLFRYDDVNGWVNAANLPYGTNVYNEAPPVVSGLDYMVSFNLTDPCTSTKAQDHNSSRSNKTASTFNGGGSTAAITDEDLGLISIYPNPANELLILHVDNPELFQYYEVTDLNGKVVATGTIMTNNTNIDLFSMEAGVYLIRLVSDEKIVVNKFVKN